jgi:hypothetical protein
LIATSSESDELLMGSGQVEGEFSAVIRLSTA